MTRNTLSRSAGSPKTEADTLQSSRRRFTRQMWGTAAMLACGVGVGTWWYWSRPWRNANARLHEAREKGLPTYGFEVVKTYDHDPQAFTQGLLFDDGVLY